MEHSQAVRHRFLVPTALVQFQVFQSAHLNSVQPTLGHSSLLPSSAASSSSLSKLYRSSARQASNRFVASILQSVVCYHLTKHTIECISAASKPHRAQLNASKLLISLHNLERSSSFGMRTAHTRYSRIETL